MQTLPKQCRDAANALESVGSFESGQGILRDAADEIERLRIMAYQPLDKHEPNCDCIGCVPF